MRVCCRCGVEKDDSEYYVNTHHRGACKPCYRKIYSDLQAARQAKTIGTANSHYQRWSDVEIEVLLEGIDEGMTLTDLAVILERTYYAVSTKVRDIHRMEICGEVPKSRAPASRDRNYVASAPDEDRWWEPEYYKEKKDA